MPTFHSGRRASCWVLDS